MLESLLEAQRKELGVENVTTLDTAKLLFVFLYRQGKLSESKKMIEDTLAIETTKFGLGHPRTITTTIHLLWVRYWLFELGIFPICGRLLVSQLRTHGYTNPLFKWTLKLVSNLILQILASCSLALANLDLSALDSLHRNPTMCICFYTILALMVLLSCCCGPPGDPSLVVLDEFSDR